MSKAIQYFLFLVVFTTFLPNNDLFSQKTLQDTTLALLPNVEIVSSKIRSDLQLHEVEGIGIFAAKKTNVVMTENLDANFALNNPRQIFAKVAGMVALENDGSGLQNNLASRGLSSNRSWEFNNRQNGYDTSADNFGYPEAYYAPPMEMVKRIEIVRGAASLQYGPQVGGLLNYVLKTAPIDKPFSVESRQTLGSFGLFNTFNAIGGTLGKFSYYTAAHFRKGDGWRDNNGFKNQNFYLNLAYKITEKANISLEANHSKYILQTVGGLTDAQSAENPRQSHRSRNWFNVPWTTAALNFNWEPQTNTKVNLKAFGLLGERNSIGFNAPITVLDTINSATGAFNPRQIDQYKFENAGLEGRVLHEYNFADNKHALAAGFRLFRGTQTRFQKGKGDVGSDFNLLLQQDKFPFEMDYSTNNAAAFVENIFRVGRLALTAGLRYEYLRSAAAGRINFASDGSPILATPTPSVRNLLLAGVGAEYHFKKHNELYGNVSSSYRPVLFSDLTPAATTDEIDPNLRDASAYNIDLGYRGEWKEFLHFDISTYYLLYKNRVGSISQLRPDGITSYQYRTNLGASRSFGTEIYVETNLFKALGYAPKRGNFSIFAALAWNNTRYGDFETTTLKNNQIVKGNLDGNRVEFAPDFVHRYGVSYSLRRFSTNFTVNQMSSVFTDANNTVLPSSNGQSGKIAGYSVLDWSSSLSFKKHYLLSFGINNLLNAHYAARRAGGFPGPGLLPGEGRSGYLTVGVKF
jgi:Fe(3+) dicitrate transport protein